MGDWRGLVIKTSTSKREVYGEAALPTWEPRSVLSGQGKLAPALQVQRVRSKGWMWMWGSGTVSVVVVTFQTWWTAGGQWWGGGVGAVQGSGKA